MHLNKIIPEVVFYIEVPPTPSVVGHPRRGDVRPLLDLHPANVLSLNILIYLRVNGIYGRKQSDLDTAACLIKAPVIITPKRLLSLFFSYIYLVLWFLGVNRVRCRVDR